MSVTTVKDRLVTLLSTPAIVPGITLALAGAARSLTAADLPACLVLTDRATRQELAADMLLVSRRYRLALLVKPWVQGVDLEAEDLCEPFFERFYAAFAERPGLHTLTNLDPLENVQNAILLEDSGVIGIELAGVGYAGIEFILQVDEYMATAPGA